MGTTLKPLIALSEELHETCNCHYPIGLVIFLLFTILSLFICICVCCFDITKLHFCKRKSSSEALRRLSIDPRFMDSSKFISERKCSLDPRIMDYNQLMNCGSISSSQSRSIDLASNYMYSTDTSLVTTV